MRKLTEFEQFQLIHYAHLLSAYDSIGSEPQPLIILEKRATEEFLIHRGLGRFVRGEQKREEERLIREELAAQRIVESLER